MDPRLRRLQSDYELVREVFSGHPHVSLQPLGTRLPPENYRVELRLRGLYLDGDQPAYRDVHHVEIMLPRRYPAEKPYVVPLEPIFHPNIRDSFCIADYWAAGTTLADVIVKLGDMIQWRVYNTASPLDAIAARWAIEQEYFRHLPDRKRRPRRRRLRCRVRSRDEMSMELDSVLDYLAEVIEAATDKSMT